MLICHYLEIAIIISFLAKSTFKFPFLELCLWTLMLKIWKKLFGILIGKSLLKKKGKFFSWQKNWSSEWNILKIFRNYIPSKKIKFNYCQFQLMNENIKRWLKERSKLTKFFIRIKKRSQTKIRSKSCILHRVKNES